MQIHNNIYVYIYLIKFKKCTRCRRAKCFWETSWYLLCSCRFSAKTWSIDFLPISGHIDFFFLGGKCLNASSRPLFMRLLHFSALCTSTPTLSFLPTGRGKNSIEAAAWSCPYLIRGREDSSVVIEAVCQRSEAFRLMTRGWPDAALDWRTGSQHVSAMTAQWDGNSVVLPHNAHHEGCSYSLTNLTKSLAFIETIMFAVGDGGIAGIIVATELSRPHGWFLVPRRVAKGGSKDLRTSNKKPTLKVLGWTLLII